MLGRSGATKGSADGAVGADTKATFRHLVDVARAENRSHLEGTCSSVVVGLGIGWFGMEFVSRRRVLLGSGSLLGLAAFPAFAQDRFTASSSGAAARAEVATGRNGMVVSQEH